MLLSHEPDVEVVDEAAGGLAAIEQTRALRPDVVVMDLRMGGMDGTEAVRRIHAENPAMRVIEMSMFEKEEIVAPFLAAGAGAYRRRCGVMVWPGTPEVLLAPITARIRQHSPTSRRLLVSFHLRKRPPHGA